MKSKLIAFLLFITTLSFAQAPSGCGSANWPNNVPISGSGVAFTVPAGSGTGWTYKWVVTPSLQIVSGGTSTTAYIRGISGNASGYVYVTRYKDGVSACADVKQVSIGGACNYTFSISDNYIDGNQSGSNTAGLNVTGGNTFPTGTTYAWTITRQDGSIQYYGPTTAQTRFVTTTYDNRITEATVVASYLNCSKTVTKIFSCAIPQSDMYGQCFSECDCSGTGGLQRTAVNIVVSPNPTSSVVKFEGKDLNNYKVSIYNYNGIEIIKSSKLDQEINLQKQDKGIYFYIITDENGFKQEGKIIKE